MKNIRAVLFPLVVLIAMIGMMTSQSMAQTVNIKIRCNTSTCLDTLRPNHTVRMLGESTSPTVPTMSWTSSSGIVLSNVGGDYWETTIQAPAGDTIKYKFWTGFTGTAGTFHWTGWDGPIDAGIPSGDNRMLLVGHSDTTLPLQYFNGWDTKVAQYWRPFESKTDSVAVYFRVNMGGATFNPATQIVDVRGGLPMGADPTWITIKQLVRETNSVNTGSFWSGVAYVPKSSITPGTTQQQFKFVIQPEIWENVGNRSFTFSSTNDTTILWYYFNNVPPGGIKVNAQVLFILKLDALEKANLFKTALGDKVAVTGAQGWPPTTFVFDTEPAMLKMTYDPGAKEWDRVEPFSKYAGEAITYKYYIAWDSSRVDSLSPNFIRGLVLTDGWEEPGVTGGADRSYTYGNTTPQTVPGDFGSDAQFFNSLHRKGAITKPIQVVFNINMAPAANVATNPNVLFRPGIDTVYIQFDGCMVPITQGKTMWGTDNRLMLSDPDGDGTYTATYNLTPPTFYQFCYRLVYTIPNGVVTNGSNSAIRGRRYYQYVHPTQVAADSAVWPSTYSLATISWMLSNLTIEDPPDLDQVTGVSAEGSEPLTYALHQNFPNPFNPSTVITYSIPNEARVRIEVYSILGQKVASLFDQVQTAGIHSIAWNAQNERGQKLSSGVYVLRMQSGSFSQVRKMMLLR
jgi:hypothetical protein